MEKEGREKEGRRHENMARFISEYDTEEEQAIENFLSYNEAACFAHFVWGVTKLH